MGFVKIGLTSVKASLRLYLKNYTLFVCEELEIDEHSETTRDIATFNDAMDVLQKPELTSEEASKWINEALRLAQGHFGEIERLRGFLRSRPELWVVGLLVPSAHTNAIFVYRDGHWLVYSG